MLPEAPLEQRTDPSAPIESAETPVLSDGVIKEIETVIQNRSYVSVVIDGTVLSDQGASPKVRRLTILNGVITEAESIRLVMDVSSGWIVVKAPDRIARKGTLPKRNLGLRAIPVFKEERTGDRLVTTEYIECIAGGGIKHIFPPPSTHIPFD